MSPRKVITHKILPASRSFSKIAFPVSCFLFLVIFLSGCSLFGQTKYAALQVTSKPEASIFLDGKHLGKTPFYSNELKSGIYSLKLTLSDATYVADIELKEGSLTVVNRELASNFLAQSGETLMLKKGLTGLLISSIPGDASVTLDGRFIGKTPTLIQDLQDGDHRLLLTKTDFVDREFTIKTSSKSQVVANVALASKFAKGRVQDSVQSEAASKIEILESPQGFVRVRQNPNATSAEIGRAKSNSQFEIIEEEDEWFKISFEGEEGWIPKEFVSEVE